MFESKELLERISLLEAQVRALQAVGDVRRDQIQTLINTARTVSDTLADIVVNHGA